MSDQQQQPEKKKRSKLVTCIGIGISFVIFFICMNLTIAALFGGDDAEPETPINEKITVEAKVTATTEPTATEAPADTPILEPTEAPTATPETKVLLSCQDCAEEGILINLWNEPGGLSATSKMLGEFEHLTVCILLDETTIDDFLWYKVRCDSIEGWLSHRLVEAGDVKPAEPTLVLIDPGTYVVGEDIEPGIYQGETVDHCYWERLSDFSGELSGTIANGGGGEPGSKFYVEVVETDFAFYTSCPLVSFTPKEK